MLDTATKSAWLCVDELLHFNSFAPLRSPFHAPLKISYFNVEMRDQAGVPRVRSPKYTGIYMIRHIELTLITV